jgi:hypothetical protein
MNDLDRAILANFWYRVRRKLVAIFTLGLLTGCTSPTYSVYPHTITHVTATVDPATGKQSNVVVTYEKML